MTEELSKGFTGIESNGVRFSSLKEMLIYIDKLRYRIINLDKENADLREIIDNSVDKTTYAQLVKKAKLADVQREQLTKAKTILNNFLKACEDYEISEARAETEKFLKEVEK